jgi:hypothetical protein
MSSVPSPGDWQLHIPTAATFKVSKRTRDRETGQIFLWDGETRIPLEECTTPASALTEYEIGDVIGWLENADSETTNLIKTAMSKVFAYPAWKQQVWQALPVQLQKKLQENQNA